MRGEKGPKPGCGLSTSFFKFVFNKPWKSGLSFANDSRFMKVGDWEQIIKNKQNVDKQVFGAEDNVVVDDQFIPAYSEFKYLDTFITKDGSCRSDINARVVMDKQQLIRTMET